MNRAHERPATRQVAAIAVAAAPVVALVAAVLGLGGCSPTFDWRETYLEGSTLVSMFPCRPDRQTRQVTLAAGSAPVAMQMLSCTTGDATFALGAADLADPAAVTPALVLFRTSALANVQASEPQASAVAIAGSTPNPEAVRVSSRGRLPDGTTVIEHAAFFAQGAKVYQASVIGAKPNSDAVETFFAGLKFKQ